MDYDNAPASISRVSLKNVFSIVSSKGNKIKDSMRRHKKVTGTNPNAHNNHLCLLPEDILEIIASFLDDKQFLVLRLTCTIIKENLYPYFALRYFRAAETDLSVSSLQNLEYLAEHHVIGPRVRELSFKPRRKDGIFPRGRFGSHFLWFRASSTGHLPNIANHTIVKWLGRMLQNQMIHCRSFTVQGFGRIDQHKDLERVSPSDVVWILMAMTADLGIRVEGLKLAPCELSTVAGLDCIKVAFDTLQPTRFRSAWETLSDLSLELTLSAVAVRWVAEIIINSKSIRKLKLAIEHCNTTRLTRNLFDRVCTAEAQPRLQELRIAHASIARAELFKFLERSTHTLEAITFCHIIILPERMWAGACLEIDTNFTSLKAISFDEP